jgi:hypothetical protein
MNKRAEELQFIFYFDNNTDHCTTDDLFDDVFPSDDHTKTNDTFNNEWSEDCDKLFSFEEYTAAFQGFINSINQKKDTCAIDMNNVLTMADVCSKPRTIAKEVPNVKSRPIKKRILVEDTDDEDEVIPASLPRDQPVKQVERSFPLKLRRKVVVIDIDDDDDDDDDEEDVEPVFAKRYNFNYIDKRTNRPVCINYTRKEQFESFMKKNKQYIKSE